MAISALPAIQAAHTAILVTRIKGDGRPPEPPEDRPSLWERFKKWWREN